MDRRIPIKKAMGAFHPGEHCLQRVMIDLWNGIKLVVVAPRTLNRGAVENRHHRADHVITVHIPAELPVQRVLADVPQGTLVPRPGRHHAQGHRGLGSVGKQHIPGHLLLDEPPIGAIGVEGLDEIVPIRPGLFPDAILIVAMGFCEVNGIHPVTRPPFAVPGRTKQSIHLTLIGLGR